VRVQLVRSVSWLVGCAVGNLHAINTSVVTVSGAGFLNSTTDVSDEALDSIRACCFSLLATRFAMHRDASDDTPACVTYALPRRSQQSDSSSDGLAALLRQTLVRGC